jgi:hypothetical protein
MGNISTLETDLAKKSMTNFLKSFGIKPEIRKTKFSSDPHDYVYDAMIRYCSSDYLLVLRFSEALQAFCLFHRMSLVEYSLVQVGGDVL